MGIQGARQLVALGLLLGGPLVGCGSASPDAESLRQAFADQITAVSTVSELERDGNELAFIGPGAGSGQARWVVKIDSLVVEPYDDESTPFRGLIQSSWYADGELIQPAGTISGLPSDFLDKGIAQDCWGLWDAVEGRWTW